jgi:hypothetical protein
MLKVYWRVYGSTCTVVLRLLLLLQLVDAGRYWCWEAAVHLAVENLVTLAVPFKLVRAEANVPP